MKYRWKSETRFAGDPQTVGETLTALGQVNDDRLVAAVVVDAARPVDSVLHPYFEWDDVRAAELYREKQASDLIRSVVVVHESTGMHVPVFVSVVETVGAETQRAYVSTARVLSDPVLTEQVLERAFDDMEAWRTRYGHFQQLVKVADRAQLELRALFDTVPAEAMLA